MSPQKETEKNMSDIFEEADELEFEIVTMTDEDGTDVEFSIIDNVASGTDRYLLVVETEKMDEDETQALILKEVAIDANDITYEMVEDDAEFDRVAELFAQKGEDYEVSIDD
ncbi:hypothetical protein B5G26_06890 [Anaerotignum lactatifermentans]|uniref:DUF1292 domain-containing protein n=2 Tax=Anaerotignum lactatifermentans TaxID=160404 RepID=A0A1Y3U456_9FIRM|nr:hypothetical protein B5G26_06890 [Anaerotignum lactatifermentans]